MKKFMVDSELNQKTGGGRFGCRIRLLMFWMGIFIISMEVACIFHLMDASYKSFRFLFEWWDQIFFVLVFELIAVISVLVSFNGPIVVIHSPFQYSLAIHDGLFGSTNIRAVAREIQARMPDWIDDGYTKISMRSHLFGRKSEDDLILMAIRFSCKCSIMPQIFVCNKNDLMTWLGNLSIRIFRPGIRVSKKDGIIVLKPIHT